MNILRLSDAWDSLPALFADGEVDVWLASLIQPANYLHRLKKTLSADELNKAEKFYFEKDRLAYITARGMLRKILGQYLDCLPSEIHFQYTPHGKPSVDAALQWNVSHSHNRVLYAISREKIVGVDIEYIRPVQEFWSAARHYFSDYEFAALQKIPEYARLGAFYTLWTRKEAYIKAIGEGLSMPLHNFDVSLHEPARLLATRPDADEANRWELWNLKTEPTYKAALVIQKT